MNVEDVDKLIFFQSESAMIILQELHVRMLILCLCRAILVHFPTDNS